MIITDRFFKFEVENRLFDILDEDGHRPWEAVRFYIYNRLVFQNVEVRASYGSTSVRKRILYILQLLLHSVAYILQHRNCPYMFMLCSRDKQNGIYFDKVCGRLFEMVDKSKTFAVETAWHRADYRYSGLSCANMILPIVTRIKTWKKSALISDIHAMVLNQFPELKMDVKEMMGYYYEFKAQYSVFKFLLRYCGTKQLYMVQNGIQKGLMAAAQELGVEVMEFQHGQISRNHPAYSYPEKGVYADVIYHPTKLLTFGEFWHQNRFYPGVVNVVIGNESYADKSVMPKTPGNDRFLVVSNMGEGELLAKRVKQIIEINSSFHFYFKLHPNQYEEKDYYITLFKEYSQVDVYSNEYTVNEILARVEGVLLIQSTIVLESLRVGRKVFVIREGAFEQMDFVFGENGVYLVDNAKDFIKTYNMQKDVKLSPRNDLFVPFREEVAKKLLRFCDDDN